MTDNDSNEGGPGMDDVLRRMLSTKPKPHKKSKPDKNHQAKRKDESKKKPA